MLPVAELIKWLESTNRRYSTQGVPHKTRPFQALSDFTLENNCSLEFRDPMATKIFEWFYEHSPPEAHQVGSVYAGVYLYDTAFWPIHVPLIYGEVSINALECLETMPAQMRQELHSSHPHIWTYMTHWANCIDYGYGRQDMAAIPTLKPRAKQFFEAAHAELSGANSQLFETRPNVKAILGLRIATEIYLKAVLVQEQDFSESQLMKISHKLEQAATACGEATSQDKFAEIAKQVSLFPPVSARYDNPNWPIELVWAGAMLAQLTAATVTRLYTDRNIGASIGSERST